MEQQNKKTSIEEVKDALRTISNFCFETDIKDCPEGCEIYQLLGGCPTEVFTTTPEDWKID